MRNTALTAFGALLIAVSTVQFASAAEHHHVRRAVHAATSEAFRNSNNAVARPSEPTTGYSGVYSGGWSAPAGQ